MGWRGWRTGPSGTSPSVQKFDKAADAAAKAQYPDQIRTNIDGQPIVMPLPFKARVKAQMDSKKGY